MFENGHFAGERQIAYVKRTFKRHEKVRTETKTTSLEERLILGKYREVPRLDYSMKHKASLLIMHIYTCVLMLYKGRRSHTPPVYIRVLNHNVFVFKKLWTARKNKPFAGLVGPYREIFPSVSKTFLGLRPFLRPWEIFPYLDLLGPVQMGRSFPG